MTTPTKKLFDEQRSLKPNRYPWTEEVGLAITDGLWTEAEFTFIGDVRQFYTELTEEERAVIVRNLITIGQVEIAIKTFWSDLGRHFPHPSLRDLGAIMAYTEVVHNRAYVKLLDKLGLEDLFDDAINNVPALSDRLEYLRKHNQKVYGDDRQQYIYSLILFTLFMENVSLFSQFYTILWFNRRPGSLLKDTAQQVQYTRIEENMHAQIGIKLINTAREEYPEFFTDEFIAKVRKEVQTAVESEGKIIDWIIGDYSAPGLDADILKGYIKHRLNISLKSIGMDPVFEVSPDVIDTTMWMQEELLGDNMTDFFHKKPTDYAKNSQSFDPVLIFGTEEEIAAYEAETAVHKNNTTMDRDLILFHKTA
jgi:ribonucleoside-diphosphate reductase beta chain